jgi:hypothetical protein
MKNFPTITQIAILSIIALLSVLIFTARPQIDTSQEIVYLMETDEYENGEDIGPPPDNPAGDQSLALMFQNMQEQSDKEQEKKYGQDLQYTGPDEQTGLTYNEHYRLFDGILFFSEYDFETYESTLTEIKDVDMETFQIIAYKDVTTSSDRITEVESEDSIFAQDKNTSYVNSIPVQGVIKPFTRLIFTLDGKPHRFSEENNSIEEISIDLNDISYVVSGSVKLLLSGGLHYQDSGIPISPSVDLSSVEYEYDGIYMKDSQNIWECWRMYFREQNVCVHIPNIDLTQDINEISQDIDDYFREIDMANEEALHPYY